ncbi:MAG: protein kinase [Gemmataceae bacterium]|nr:protein kinase [Gemmataceae bacterium]
MANDRAGTLIDLLRDSRLLEPAALTQLNELASSPGARDEDPHLLAQCVVELGWLTRFQLDLVRERRASDLKLGAYLLLERLGTPFNPCYKARRPGKPGVVSLKLIRKNRFPTPEIAARFIQDVRVGAGLQHPYVAPVSTVGQLGSMYLFAREYVEGTDLDRLVRTKGPLPIHQACEYVRQAATALQYAHDKGLSHRRLKPANIILCHAEGASPNGTALVKVVDFGLAQVRPAPTVAGVDVEADLLGLGRTLHMLLTGKLPAAVQPAVPTPPGATAPGFLDNLRPGVPSEVQSILRTLLKAGGGPGFRGANEVALALEPFCREAVEISMPTPAVNGTPAAAPAPQLVEAATLAVPVATAAAAAAMPVEEVLAVTEPAEAPPEPPAPFTPEAPQEVLTVTAEIADAVPVETTSTVPECAEPIALTSATEPEPVAAIEPEPVATAEPAPAAASFEPSLYVPEPEPEPLVLVGIATPVMNMSGVTFYPEPEPFDFARTLGLHAMPDLPPDEEPKRPVEEVIAATAAVSTVAEPVLESSPAPVELAMPVEPEVAGAFNFGDAPASPEAPVQHLAPAAPLDAGFTESAPMGHPAESSPFTNEAPVEDDGGFPMSPSRSTTATAKRPRKKWSRGTIMWLIVGGVLHLIALVILIVAVSAMFNANENPPPRKLNVITTKTKAPPPQTKAKTTGKDDDVPPDKDP